MDGWEGYYVQKKGNNKTNHIPSFSSTLLEAIYRSIDDGEEEFYREKMRKKENLERARVVEKWMIEKKMSEKVIIRRKSTAETNHHSQQRISRSYGSSSSSDSSSGGGFFSSSDAESSFGFQKPTKPKPKPIRTSRSESHHEKQIKHENGFGGFNRTKSRALKIYGDLKKVKQPISPGGKLATFLNSLFTNAKKSKVSAAAGVAESKSSAQASSTCSSASSFSRRSCLSKTPSSKFGNGVAKRSVRFYPMSVIVDEDCRPCGHKTLYSESDEPHNHTNFLDKFERKIRHEYEDDEEDEDDEEEEDDDAFSCSSSDLFELDNLSTLGIERYRQELPVYETTHFDTNRDIANGYLM
ncbi:hypothetical protein RJ641_023973 [Dillenia turbinata]|uniref:Protein BIG GRAIN 1-like B n=1 Tax=Dillenia turbinata TaxID=194707 RepID=A0AAN8YTC0_9MAGN